MAKRRRHVKAEAPETEEAKEERQRYRILTANAIFGEEFTVEEEDGERFVEMTPTEARKHTDADVRLTPVE